MDGQYGLYPFCIFVTIRFYKFLLCGIVNSGGGGLLRKLSINYERYEQTNNQEKRGVNSENISQEWEERGKLLLDFCNKEVVDVLVHVPVLHFRLEILKGADHGVDTKGLGYNGRR